MYYHTFNTNVQYYFQFYIFETSFLRTIVISKTFD